MIEQNQKKFFEFFKHYKPDEKIREILDKAYNVRVRVAKEPLRIEVLASFDSVVRNATLYPIEEELRVLYEALSFRILPTFPAEAFRPEYMTDVIEEAVRAEVIARGFF